MQKQIPGSPMAHLPTIEGALEEALKSIGAFTEAQIADYARLQWSRVGRTDKGVHAVCQVVTCKLTLGPVSEADKELKSAAKALEDNAEDLPAQPLLNDASAGEKERTLSADELERANKLQRIRELDFLQRLRQAVPDDFEIHDVTRVPNQFDARFQCQQRQYEYCFPSYVLRRCEFNDNTHLIKEFFEKFASHVAVVTGRPYEPMPANSKRRLYDILQDTTDVAIPWKMTKDELAQLCLEYRREMYMLRRSFSKLNGAQRRSCWSHFEQTEYEGGDDKQFRYPPPALLSFRQVPLTNDEKLRYKMSEADFEKFEAILKKYLGHHHWFNYASKVNSDDPSGARAIQMVELHRAMFDETSEGEILVVRLKGSSFLLNQIRKMMSMAVECMIGTAPYAANSYLIQPPLLPKKHLHLAPGEGLLLERAFFDIVSRSHKEELRNMVLHDEYEQSSPFGQRLNDLLEKGIVISKEEPKPFNPLVDDEPPRADEVVEKVETMPWFSGEADDQPTWFRLLKFKHQHLYPMMQEIFRTEQTFSLYLSDIQWHPFFTENFPEPCPKDYFKQIDLEQQLGGTDQEKDASNDGTLE